jgi:E3 ubiquitin-protein ligase ZNF598
MCTAPNCLEQKFVVFDSEIDLQAHQVEVHATQLASDKRSRAAARRIETHFTYGDEPLAPPSERGGGGRGAEGSRRRVGGAGSRWRNNDQSSGAHVTSAAPSLQERSSVLQQVERIVPGLGGPAQRQTRATFAGGSLTPDDAIPSTSSRSPVASRPQTPNINETPSGRTPPLVDPDIAA